MSRLEYCFYLNDKQSDHFPWTIKRSKLFFYLSRTKILNWQTVSILSDKGQVAFYENVRMAKFFFLFSLALRRHVRRCKYAVQLRKTSKGKKHSCMHTYVDRMTSYFLIILCFFFFSFFFFLFLKYLWMTVRLLLPRFSVLIRKQSTIHLASNLVSTFLLSERFLRRCCE